MALPSRRGRQTDFVANVAGRMPARFLANQRGGMPMRVRQLRDLMARGTQVRNIVREGMKTDHPTVIEVRN
jgi:hypothetical protein